jgi:hypothetical protein
MHLCPSCQSECDCPRIPCEHLCPAKLADDRLPPVQFVECERCGHDRSEHHSANLTDGVFVGRYLLICPDVIFLAEGYDVDGTKLMKRRK